MAATTTYQHSHPHSHFSPPSHPSTPLMRPAIAQRGHTDSSTMLQSDRNMSDTTDAVTPTKSDFGGMAGQRPLPSTPFTPGDLASTPGSEKSELDVLARQSKSLEDEDVEMGEDGDDKDDSDNDSTSSDPQRPRKKKKGQRFFCTDFPPCNLSFTRSEHLARHIRKHTGERPFQCHCGRRFSRLDNLRQHAQTVHVNEDIPGDSLAATGTRFQRQIRTDRVRAPGGRPRAGTGASAASHGRGHSRNLSTSSIASTASNISTFPEDVRRRPPPLAIAQDSPRRMTMDAYGPPPVGVIPGGQYAYYPAQHPGSGFSTPTSATFSTGGNSPRFPAVGQSPTVAPRVAYYQPDRSARRLSVPSVASPYQAYAQAVPFYAPVPPPGMGYHSSAFSTSSIASPTTATYGHSRRDSEAELELRRRTWHPGTYAAAQAQRPATSGLTYQQTPDDARPTTAGQSAASQVTRLPGIESFDHAAAAVPAAPRQVSPMQVDNSGRPPLYHGPSDDGARGPDTHTRRTSSIWDASLHQGLNRLDIAGTTPPRPAPLHARPPLPVFSFPQAPAEAERPPPMHRRTDSSSSSSRRQGWYGGPLNRSQPINIAHRASPEESGSSDGVPTPSTSHGKEAHPAIIHPNGLLEVRPPGVMMSEEQQQAMQTAKPEPARADSGSHLYMHASRPSQDYAQRSPLQYAPQPRTPNDMGRLEALVAVATSENAQR